MAHQLEEQAGHIEALKATDSATAGALEGDAGAIMTMDPEAAKAQAKKMLEKLGGLGAAPEEPSE